MLHFTNNAVDINSLPKYQQAPVSSIHEKYWNVMVINLLIVAIFIFIATGIGLVSIYQNSDFGSVFYLLILVFVIGFVTFLFWINRVAFRKRGYVVRERDLFYRSGVLSTTTTIIPFNRIQHIAVNEGMFSRMYGLASLEIYTAGGNSSDLSISGIEKEKAYEIKEFLMSSLNNYNVKNNSNVNVNNDDNNNEDDMTKTASSLEL